MMQSSEPRAFDGADVVRGPDGLPASIRLFAVGDNPDVRGLNAVYDVTDAEKILAANNRTDGSMPIDVNHLSMMSDNPDAQGAVGWARLRCDATGIWADIINWIPPMDEKLSKGVFRFYSPVFDVDQVELLASDGKEARITCVQNFALTNDPATCDIEPIMAKKHHVGVARSLAGARPGNPGGPGTCRSGTKIGASPIRKSNMADDNTQANATGELNMDNWRGLSADEQEEAMLSALSTIRALQVEAKRDVADGDDKDDKDDDEEEDDSEDAEDEESKRTKRSLANGLVVDGFLSVAQRRAMLALPLKDVQAKDKELRMKSQKKGHDRSVSEPHGDHAVTAEERIRKELGLGDTQARVARNLRIPVADMRKPTISLLADGSFRLNINEVN